MIASTTGLLLMSVEEEPVTALYNLFDGKLVVRRLVRLACRQFFFKQPSDEAEIVSYASE